MSAIVILIALTAVTGLVAPGWVVARAWGLRGTTALGAAPPLSLGLLAPATVLAGLSGTTWDRLHLVTGPAAWLWGAVVVAGLALRRRRGQADPQERVSLDLAPLGRAGSAAVAGGLCLAALLTAVPAARGTGAPDSPPQASDAVFHLSATAFVRATGQASPLGGLAPMYDGRSVYYPTAWHALAALLPGDVVTGANVLVIVVAALVWPLGVAALLREVLGRGPDRAVGPGVVLAVGTALSGSVISVLLVATSVWPYALSVALLPGALALAARATAAGRPGARQRGRALVLAALGCVGVVGAHGAAVFNLAVLAGPLVVAGAWPPLRRTWRSGGSGRATLVAALTAGALALAAGTWVMRTSLAAVLGYPRGRANPWETLFALLTDHPLLATYTPWVPGNVVLTVLAALGVVAVLGRRAQARWLVGAGVAVVLLLLAAGPDWPGRGLAGPWYTQRARIMPLVTIGLLILAALGLEEARRRWDRPSPPAPRVRSAPGPATTASGRLRTLLTRNVPVTVLAASLLVAPAWRWGLKTEVLASVHDPERIVYGAMLSAEEITLLRRAPEALPADAVVLGDPSNGSAYLWPVAGVRVLYPSRPLPPAGDLVWLGENLRRIGTDPEVCRILTERGVGYYYTDDAPVDGTTGGVRTPLWGQDLVRLPREYLERIDSQGTATLWRITACD